MLAGAASVFVRHRMNLVFSGYDYERTKPIGGVTYVVTGGGGQELYRAGESERTASSASENNSLTVRLDGEDVHLEALRPDGGVLDRFDLGNPD